MKTTKRIDEAIAFCGKLLIESSANITDIEPELKMLEIDRLRFALNILRGQEPPKWENG